MKRTLSVLLICLFVLVAMAAPRPAAAQDYGKAIRIVGVASTFFAIESISVGQRQTALDHGNYCLDVKVYVPRFEPKITVTFRGRSGQVTSQANVYVKGARLGTVYTYNWAYYYYDDGLCIVQQPNAWGTPVTIQTLWIR